MTVDETDLAKYRAELRTWLAANMPRIEPGQEQAWRHNNSDPDGSHAKTLMRKLASGGYTGICYPKEYGGQGRPIEYQRVFDEESTGYEMPSLFSVPTASICGPTILEFGTEEQKQRYIPKFLSGDELWVQFMSEPSGGSDMAGALTRATRDGDIFLLNGSKIWSTFAYRSDYALCLARTNWDVPKHRGLTMFIVPIHHPGIEIQQIRMVDGSVEFCQEFFTDAVIPVENVVGQIDDGWTVASRLLFHERAAVGGASPYTFGREVGGSHDERAELVNLAKRAGRAQDPIARQLVGKAETLATVQRFLVNRVRAGLQTGYFPSVAGSIARLYGGLSRVERSTIAMELSGGESFAWDENDHSMYGVQYVQRQGACLGGGSTEMARNIISERILGMPREYAADKELPFSEVRRNKVAGPR